MTISTISSTANPSCPQHIELDGAKAESKIPSKIKTVLEKIGRIFLYALLLIPAWCGYRLYKLQPIMTIAGFAAGMVMRKEMKEACQKIINYFCDMTCDHWLWPFHRQISPQRILLIMWAYPMNFPITLPISAFFMGGYIASNMAS
jgi:hypothetical protein